MGTSYDQFKAELFAWRKSCLVGCLVLLISVGLIMLIFGLLLFVIGRIHGG